jgi:hypothetical protein
VVGLDESLFVWDQKCIGFYVFSSVIVSVVVPYSCRLCRMCCAYADCGWLFLMYLICSRHLVLRLRLVCPMYALLHVLHVILYTPLFSRSCVALGFRVFFLCCIVFVVLNADDGCCDVQNMLS